MPFLSQLQQANLLASKYEKTDQPTNSGVEASALLKVKQNISLLAEISQMQRVSYSPY